MPPRNSKRRTLLHSFRDAFRGIWHCLQSERNMRIHMVACGYVLFFSLKAGVSRGELACLLVAMGVVTCAETMNTSIEKLCDFAQKRHSRIIGNIKDLAAGAVLLSAVFAALAGGGVLLRPAFWAVWEEILMQPKKLAVFILSLAASMALVFAVPLKRE